MGRGRGKGKKLTLVSSHDDQGSGEEVIPAYKRRGRPQKPLKDEIDDEDAEKIEEEDVGEDDIKPTLPSKDFRGLALENGKKRRRRSQVKENHDSTALENGAAQKSSNEDPVIYNGFRHNGSRRKNKPRRAAEAGVDC